MLAHLPIYISLIFALTTVATLLLFSRIITRSIEITTRENAHKIIIGLTIWLIVQAFLTLKNSYNSDPNLFPPKILLFGILPPVLLIVLLFVTSQGRKFIDGLSLIELTYLNTIRIPVEMTLFWLYLYKAVPELMTFEGRNFDILAGITAPIMAYFGLIKGIFNRKIFLVWNFISLGLLINIVVYAFFSTPSPVQKFAFEQPNIAILNFPFSWLPTFVVPIILFGHLVAIRQFFTTKKTRRINNIKQAS